MITRTDIINHFIKKNDYTSYLEIGVQRGANFRAVECSHKVGVDPDPKSKATKHMTSDAFFATNTRKFDIIFVDGLHTTAQTFRDIMNALRCLSPTGIVVCHDMNPPDYESQEVPRVQNYWNGDCWMAWVMLRGVTPGLEMIVLDTDCGCGIIRRSDDDHRIEIEENITFENLAKNRQKWLNLQPAETLHSLDW